MAANSMLAAPPAAKMPANSRSRDDIRVALMVPCMVYFAAGFNLTSTQDHAPGDALTATAADPSAHRTAIVIAAPFIAWVLIKYGSLLLNTLRDNLALSSLLLWAALSAIWSQSPAHTLAEAATLAGTTLLALWMAQTVDWQTQLKMIVYGGAVAALLSVILAVGMPGRGIDYEHGGAWQGIFISKNHLGRMMLFFLTTGFYYRSEHHGTVLARSLRYGYILLCLGLIGMSRSKTAIAITILYLLFTAGMFLARRLRVLDRKYLLLSLTVLFTVLAALVLPNLTSIIVSMGGDPTLTGRTVIWSQLLISFWKHPLTGYGFAAFWGAGEGWSAFMRVYGAMHFTAAYAHSGYMGVLLDLGIVGLSLIMAMIAKATMIGLSEFGGEHPDRIEWCLAILFISVIYNVDEVTFAAARALPWILLLLACLNLSVLQKKKRSMMSHPNDCLKEHGDDAPDRAPLVQPVGV